MAALADRQHGIVSRQQLMELGLGASRIDYRVWIGRLRVVHRGIYAVGHDRLTGRGRWMAATLACGKSALLSHVSAASLWGLLQTGAAHIHVTSPRHGRQGRRGIVLHRVRAIPADDRTEVDAIPVTSVARTLFDLAEVVDPGRLRRAFEAAERLGVLDLGAVECTCERNNGRRALRPVLALLPSLNPAPDTRSELERRFLALCRDHELRLPVTNRIVEGFEVDAVWVDRRLVVELDGYEFHRTRAAFERDRGRDAALQLAGYRVLRLTWWRLVHEPGAVAQMIAGLLADGR